MRISDWSSDVCSSDLDSCYRVPAAGGVNSSIKDLTIWMMAQMGRAPDVLPDGALDEVQEPRVGTPGEKQIGKASCRERGCQYGYISVVAVSYKKKITY